MHKLWVIAAICGSLPALAWGPEGHSLVARIAEAQLTPQARARVAEILGPNATMASISSWPDQVRRERPETGSWHYVDIPIDKSSLDLARDCPKSACVVAQVEADEAALRNPAAPAEQRREALMFLIHFIGDMHQPLHSSDNKDKGGNDVHVVFFDRPGNLHGTWDIGLVARMGKEEELFPVLLKEAREHAGKWSGGTPAQWADEAHQWAVKVAYGKLPKAPEGGIIALGADYQQAAEPVVREQIEKAGDRLARVLNEVLQ
jgi:nuclease S1